MSRWETRTYREDGSWWIVEVRDDSSRTVTTYDEVGTVIASRPYTSEEADEADDRLALAARRDDHEARIARIEAHLWPAPPDPTEPTDAPEWGDLDEPNRWPHGGLLLDTDGKVYRNTSGTILTTPPSGFPGGGAAWLGTLFALALDSPEPEPDPDTGVLPWTDKGSPSYKVGDLRTWPEGSSTVYRCRQDHTAWEGAGYNPSVASLWEVAP